MRRPSALLRLASTVLATLTWAGEARAVEDDAPVEPPPPPAWGFRGPYSLRLGAALGIGARLDDPPGFLLARRAGLLGEVEVELGVSRRVGFALVYTRSSLGREEALLEGAVLAVDRRLDAGWLPLRLRLVEVDAASLLVDVAPGVAWQHASLSGELLSPTTPGAEPIPFRCSATGAGFGFRVGAGGEVRVTDALRLGASLSIDNLRFSSDVIGDCVPGAGASSVFGARLGLRYRFDL
ncbi:MAG: hypothetical protein AAGA56_04435 [Myxococcota bacterium]